MALSVYFTAAESNCGTQAVAQAYLDTLISMYPKVGVFRTFTNGPVENEAFFLNLLDKAGQSDELSRAWGATIEDCITDEDDAMNSVVSRFTSYAKDYDAVLILGQLDGDPALPGYVARHGRAAAHLSSGVVLTASASLRSGTQVAHIVKLATEELARVYAPVKATVIVDAADEVQEKVNATVSPVVHVPAGSSFELSGNDTAILTSALVENTGVVTPLAWTSDLVARAQSDKKRIVLPESEDDRILYAAAEVLERNIADVILLGEPDSVHARAAELGINLSHASIISMNDQALVEKYATEFARLREKKGVTYDQAVEKMKDVSYFATMMVHMNDADGMVSGAAHTTAHTIVPSFQIIKTKPGTSTVSSIFLMLMKDRVYAYGDCAVNTNPTPEELASIAISSAETAAQFGVEPRVAMLSYSTGTSGKGPDVDAVTEATRLAKEARPDLLIEGPIQYDASVDEAVAAKKLPGSPVAGKATVFIFPSLNAGNIGYKAVQRSAGAVAVGPILQGLNKPVNDLSRGALVEDIVNTVAITAVQAQQA